MVDHRASPRYRSYLLRFWQERSCRGDELAVWRFSLEDPHTQVRHGFASLDEVVAAMMRDMHGTNGSDDGLHVPASDALANIFIAQEEHMQTERHTEDDVAIRALIGAVEAGWNAGDGDAFAALFAADADYVVVDGRYINGRDVIAQGHRQIFSTVYRGSRNRATVRSIRLLRDDVAVAHVEWHLAYGQGEAAREARATNTMILTKDGSSWSIAAFHNTPVLSS
jgi:uncharacterized protein (TIGR02246 family)